MHSLCVSVSFGFDSLFLYCMKHAIFPRCTAYPYGWFRPWSWLLSHFVVGVSLFYDVC